MDAISDPCSHPIASTIFWAAFNEIFSSLMAKSIEASKIYGSQPCNYSLASLPYQQSWSYKNFEFNLQNSA